MYAKFKDVDIGPWGYEAPVRLRRMSAVEMATWTNELARMTNTRIAGKRTTMDLQPGMADLVYLELIIIGGPLEADRNKLGKEDWELIAYLAREGEKLNHPFVMRDEENSCDGDTSTGHLTQT